MLSMLEPFASFGPDCHLYHCDHWRLLEALPDRSVDWLITDQPYSSGGLMRSDRAADPRLKYHHKTSRQDHETFSGDNRDGRSYLRWVEGWLERSLRLLKPGGGVVLFTDWRQLSATADALQCAGLVWRGLVPWDKTESCRPEQGAFASQCEYLVWGTVGKRRPDYLPCLKGLFRHRVDHRDKHHLTGKPTPLMLEVVEICPPGGTVLDLFSGSFTTAEACLRTGRRFVGCERSEHYCQVGAERLDRVLAELGADRSALAELRSFGGWSAPCV
jgi:site-specific DNA-methyltransferase (adenine-specific)